ncbi:DUF2863 family protein [Orrella sp. 11846]|uniref:DUF2863 family protein n=1 Tax=Orrella sp. 11846 TaxID=3409913 RepID=UPI003B5AD2D7
MSKPKRSSKHISVSAAQKKLHELAQYWDAAMSVYEERFFEHKIEEILIKVFNNPNQGAIEEVLKGFDLDDPASQIVIDIVTKMSEHVLLDLQDQTLDCIILSMPTVVWSRYKIPKPQPDDKIIEAVLDGLKRYIVTSGTKIAIMPAPTSNWDTPKSFSASRHWLKTLAQRLKDPDGPLPIPTKFFDQFEPNADAQHWVFVAANLANQPILQRMGNRKFNEQTALKAWQAHMESIYKQLYPGCQIDILLPDLLENAAEAVIPQEQIRNIHAAIDRIEMVFNTPRDQICANIIRMVDDEFEEYRIGYNLQGQNTVIYGTPWFISTRSLGDEFDDMDDDFDFLDDEFDEIDDELDDDLEDDSVDQTALSEAFDFFDELDDTSPSDPDLEIIIETLRACGINQINIFDQVLPSMYCQGCERPLFPGPDGLHHLTAPDDTVEIPPYLH